MPIFRSVDTIPRPPANATSRNQQHTTTMVFRLLICALLSNVVSAAPALIWSGGDKESIYTSHEVPASELLDDSANLQIVFLLGRGSDGSESLTQKAPFLSGISQNAANFVHNDVSGIESVHSVVRMAGKQQTAVVSLTELGLKFNTSEINTKKARDVKNANVLVVNVDAETSPGALDEAVSQVIPKADRVVLTAIRSIDEVKAERAKITRRRLEMQQASYHRRLEDQQDNGDGDNNNDNNDEDNAGVYFVQMTPNILAGLLFFFLFATIAYIGISCMGMIAAQDVYVKKMPAVGREA